MSAAVAPAGGRPAGAGAPDPGPPQVVRAARRSSTASTSRSPSTRSSASSAPPARASRRCCAASTSSSRSRPGRIEVGGRGDHRAGRQRRPRPAADRHRLPGVQPVPAPARPRQRDPRAAARPRAPARGGGGGGPDAPARPVRARATRRREFPDRLSGGQQQRVAIVRALAMEPAAPAPRRDHERARPGADRRGPGRRPRAREGRA